MGFGRKVKRGFVSPVKQGDVCDVLIESVGGKGDGVAKVSNFVVFVPGTAIGDRVSVRVTRVLEKFAFAEVISPDEGSPGEMGEVESEEV